MARKTRIIIHRTAPNPSQGIALAYLLVACALLVILSAAGFSLFFPMLKSNEASTLATQNQRLVTQAAYLLAAESSDSDGDGAYEPPAFQTAAAAPASGGVIPAASRAPQQDAWGTPLGYCAWDNGTTNSSTNRIRGDNPANRASITLAVISAGRQDTPSIPANGVADVARRCRTA